MSTFRALALAAVMAVATTVTALAAPIPFGSNFGMSGAFRAEDNAGTNVAFTLATRLDFVPLTAGAGTGSGLFTTTFAVSGAFATDFFPGTPGLTTGTIADLQFVGFAGPIVPLWTITNVVSSVTAAFDLNTLSIDTQTNSAIVLSGKGTLHLTGYDATAGTWSFSGNTAGSSPIGTFSWSADATPVPEPMSLALFGAGLLGLGMARRARKQV